jgi:hypothetical protein
VLDVGNLTPGSRPYELMKLRYLAEGMVKIGYDAVNLGKTDAELDRETLKRFVQDSGLPFVSANVMNKETRAPLTESYRIIRRGSLRIGITGVTRADSRDVGPGLEVRPPIEALSEIIPALKRQCDYLIVLAFVDEDGLREIATKFHEVDCLLGGDVPQTSNAVQEINRAAVFSVVDHGKVLGEIDLKRDGDSYKVALSHGTKILRDTIKPHKDMVALIARYKNELRDRRYELASAEDMERIVGQASTADEYVGEKSCVSCHAEASRVCAVSAHNNALQTLIKNKSDFDPDCLRCHTVGYGLHSGFVDAAKTPNLGNVQCENCHGRGKEHIIAMRAVLEQPTLQGALSLSHRPSTLKPVTQATCISCHDKENSENFQYSTFWPRIAHGKSWPDMSKYWNERKTLLAGSGAQRSSSP